ncbi:MAG: tRNA (5-methylaminomethyl-2-thiouridine)(34)-methyltransferase MnmD, partial [Oceanococcaceae bacterium]
MPTQIRRAEVAWKEDGTPWSPAYGDVFHSRAGGLAQTEHVFIQGNDLLARWAQGQAFRVGELGLGSGLNFLCTVQRFLQCSPAGSQLNYVGIEAEPWTPADVQQLLQGSAIDPALLQQWLEALDALQPGANRLLLAHGRVRLSLFVGRVEDCLPQLRAQMDAWYLDGFNPASNQAMWQADLFGALARWCCAGQVRRDLQAAGFALQKAPGFAHKREMLCGKLPGQSSTPPAEAVVEVIGAGLAGCWQARVLAERGCQVELYDSAKGPAQGASQMPMLIVRPYARHRDTPTARFFWQAAHWAAQRSQQFLGDGWHAGPVWREFGSESPHWLEPAGWYPGEALCAVLLEHPNIRSHWSCPAPVAREHPRIWCTGMSPSQGLHRPRAIRGQQSLWPAGAGQLQGHTPRVGDCVAAESAEGL